MCASLHPCGNNFSSLPLSEIQWTLSTIPSTYKENCLLSQDSFPVTCLCEPFLNLQPPVKSVTPPPVPKLLWTAFALLFTCLFPFDCAHLEGRDFMFELLLLSLFQLQLLSQYHTITCNRFSAFLIRIQAVWERAFASSMSGNKCLIKGGIYFLVRFMSPRGKSL